MNLQGNFELMENRSGRELATVLMDIESQDVAGYLEEMFPEKHYNIDNYGDDIHVYDTRIVDTGDGEDLIVAYMIAD